VLSLTGFGDGNIGGERIGKVYNDHDLRILGERPSMLSPGLLDSRPKPAQEKSRFEKMAIKKGLLSWLGRRWRISARPEAPVTTTAIDQFGQQLTILRVSRSNRALTPRDGGILISQRGLSR
jgi:hypothetical protein